MQAGIRTRDLRKVYTSPPPLASGGGFGFARGKGNKQPKPAIIALDGLSLEISPGEIFGQNVFSKAVMQQRLPKAVFKSLMATIEHSKPLDPTVADRISHGRQIIAFRNRLIHGYASVADDVVWGVWDAADGRMLHELRGHGEQRPEHFGSRR